MRVILILGFGLSGKAAAKLASIKGYKVYVYDDCFKKDESNLSDFIYLNSAFEFLDLKDPLVVLSPGIDFREDRFSVLRQFEVISEVRFALFWLKGKKIAVTGTNGKSTTVNLISHILNCEGIKAVPCGNFGVPLSSIVLEEKLDDYIKVIELSSFQLEKLENVQFDVSVCMAITEDHLNRYDSFKEYKDAKMNLFLKNPPANHLVVDKDLVKENSILEKSKQVTIIDGLRSEKEINLEILDESIAKDIELNITFKETSLSYPHDKQNLLYAICACFSFKNNLSHLQDAILSYKPLPYRLELLTTTDKGLKVINDFKCLLHLKIRKDYQRRLFIIQKTI